MISYNKSIIFLIIFSFCFCSIVSAELNIVSTTPADKDTLPSNLNRITFSFNQNIIINDNFKLFTVKGANGVDYSAYWQYNINQNSLTLIQNIAMPNLMWYKISVNAGKVTDSNNDLYTGMTVYLFTLLGDANNDGRINTFDILNIRNYVATPPLINWRQNINGDSGINVFDMLVARDQVGNSRTAFSFNNNYAYWQDRNYGSREEVDIRGGENVLYNFTVFLNISYNNAMKNDFSDIIFYSGVCGEGNATLLKYEKDSVESFSSGRFWVKIPKLIVGTNPICMYFNNSNAVNSEDKKNAWDNQYLAVWHFSEGAGQVYDSLGRFNLTLSGGSANPVNMRFGRGRELDGNNYFYVDDSNSQLTNSSGITLEAYIVNKDSRPWRGVFNHIRAENVDRSYYLSIGGTPQTTLSTEVSSDGTTYGREYINTNSNNILIGNWVQVGMMWTHGTNLKVFNNKLSITSAGIPQNTMYPSTANLILGWSVPLDVGFSVQYDEARISGIERSSAWINRSYDNFDSSFVVYNTPENPPVIAPFIILNSPENNSLFNISSVIMNCSAIINDAGIVNLTLIIDDKINFTVYNTSSNQNLSLQTNVGFTDGNHNWTCKGTDSKNQSKVEILRNFIVDAVLPIPYANLLLPVNNYFANNKSVNFICNVSNNFDPVYTNTTLFIWNSLGNIISSNKTNSNLNSNFSSFMHNLNDGSYLWNCLAADRLDKNFSDFNNTLFVDTVKPNVTLDSPAIGATIPGSNVYFNFTIMDVNPFECRLDLFNQVLLGNTMPSIQINNPGQYSINYTFPGCSDADIWTVNCTDKAGNAFRPVERLVIVNSC